MRRTRWSWMRALGCAAILVVLVWRFGTGAFLDGLAHVEVWSLAAAGGIAVVTTVCCAWRWTLVARGLGVAVPLRTAVAAYHRSQFLNVATPGGVLGDVDRAVRHGRDVGDTSRGLRSVVWERFAGQLVLIAVAGCTVSVLPSPVRPPGRVVGAAVVVGMVTIGLLALSIRSGPLPVWARTLGRARVDLRAGVLARHTWPGVLVTSALALAGYVLTFLIAARTAGSSASPLQLLPLALLVIVAMGLPSIVGWGPREGMAAWAFGAAGLGAGQGVATAVVYGVMVLVASLPGAVLLVMSRLRRAPFGAGPGHDRWPVAAASAGEGAADD